ncbi:hypothetical protein E4U42_003749 [Claviceps africana]|uniref:Uncharacterized protein n=1 Tax=Claviceps africana TaxID=83212 RepID=A0A8K0J677_9HYPO|nr:hypothetical protein E4U42_003749 [Claviceps africana]
MESHTGDYVQDDHASLSSAPPTASSGSGLLSKLPFMRASTVTKVRQDNDHEFVPTSQSLHAVTQQHKTRRRRGSLRKAALLGRGAQRRDNKPLTIDTSQAAAFNNHVLTASSTSCTAQRDALGLHIFDLAPPASSKKSHEAFQASVASDQSLTKTAVALDRAEAQKQRPQQSSYISTTDEEDVLQMGQGLRPASSVASVSSGSESYFAARAVAPRRRSFQPAKSPLSYSNISKKALPPSDSDWDYSETEWWGWAVLTTTWLVFVVGMGSCLNVWKWAWDVGKTPYAPPELEDDPTLPIDGYYPALIILTGVMAWVWVVVAWVGMKYFRHAKISGD